MPNSSLSELDLWPNVHFGHAIHASKRIKHRWQVIGGPQIGLSILDSPSTIVVELFVFELAEAETGPQTEAPNEIQDSSKSA